MNGLLGNGRVFAYAAPVDLRLGYSGLAGLVRTRLQQDPVSGDLFLFVSRTRRGCKVLRWDGTGLCIFMKKLERGRFAPLWRRDDDKPVRSVVLSRTELSLFVEGCTLVGTVPLSPTPVDVSFEPGAF